MDSMEFIISSIFAQVYCFLRDVCFPLPMVLSRQPGIPPAQPPPPNTPFKHSPALEPPTPAPNFFFLH